MINLKEWYDKNVFNIVDPIIFVNEYGDEISVAYSNYYNYDVVNVIPATDYEAMKVVVHKFANTEHEKLYEIIYDCGCEWTKKAYFYGLTPEDAFINFRSTYPEYEIVMWDEVIGFEFANENTLLPITKHNFYNINMEILNENK